MIVPAPTGARTGSLRHLRPRGTSSAAGRCHAMTLAAVDSPLAADGRAATPTDYWNDSCAAAELAYAVERGATGATSNPVIVGEVLHKEREHWVPRVRELAAANPRWSETEVAWALIEEMGVRGAAILRPVFDAHDGTQGPPVAPDEPRGLPDAGADGRAGRPLLAARPEHPGQVPVHRRQGSRRSRRRRPAGSSPTSPSCSPSPSASPRPRPSSAACGASRRRAATRAQFSPVCSLMVGRLDDWVKVLVERDAIALDPDAANWAGIAAFKRAYAIYRERGYRTRLLAAAYRHRLHWTELVGGDVVMTMPHAWQVRFNASGIEPVEPDRRPGGPAPRRRPA